MSNFDSYNQNILVGIAAGAVLYVGMALYNYYQQSPKVSEISEIDVYAESYENFNEGLDLASCLRSHGEDGFLQYAVYANDPYKKWTVPTPDMDLWTSYVRDLNQIDLNLSELQVTVDVLYMLDAWNPPTLILGLVSNLVVVSMYGSIHAYLLNCFPVTPFMDIRTWDNGFLEKCKEYAEIGVSLGLKPSFQIDFTCSEYKFDSIDLWGERKVERKVEAVAPDDLLLYSKN